ncbi:MAG: hypothetical protein ABI573_03940 [Chloroflexota bacterium]
MRTADSLSRDEWERILYAPFHAYMHVGGVGGPPIEAQFRYLTEEFAAGHDAFSDGSVGAMMTAALTENLDPLWTAFQADGRSPKDGLSRARKTLSKVSDTESEAVRDWLIALASGIGQVRRVMGNEIISPGEAAAISDVAGWLGRPVPQDD